MALLTELIITGLAVGLFVLLLALSGKANLDQENRPKQFLMPLVAVLYSIPALLLADQTAGLVTVILETIGEYVPPLLFLTPWAGLINNILLILLFLALKSTLLPLIDKIWSKPGFLFHYISGKIYEFSEYEDMWILKKEFGQAKALWKGFYWFGIGISSLILALSQLYPDWLVFRTPFYPVFGILVLGEIFFFLSGPTGQDSPDINGDVDESYRVTNYGMLRRVFHDLFDDRILYDNQADALSGLSSFDMLDTLADSTKELDVVVSGYFSALKGKGQTVDPGFVRASIDMANGKSVLLNVPFYQDLTGYIILPLVRRLLSYDKALIIVGRDSAAEDVRCWLHEGIAATCGTSELWKTGILTEQETGWDVAVLRFADVYNRSVLEAGAAFLDQVGFVLLIEPSRIISTGQTGLTLLGDRLAKGSDNIVYCSCDRNCDGLVDTLSHILKVNLTEVFATVPSPANCSLMYWNAHGNFLHHTILPNIAHYLGVGTELSAVALRNQVAKTLWVSSDRFPVLDIRWIAGQYHQTICRYINFPQSQEALAGAFRVESNLWNLDTKDNVFITVEDEFNNLFEMTRLYATRAKKQGFVNVISENYLLRDYMIDNASLFATDSKVIPSIVADYTRTEKNTVVELIMGMFGGCISETELKHKLSLAGIEFCDPFHKLCELVIKHCHVDTVSIAPCFRDEIIGDDMELVKSIYYAILDNDTQLADYARTFSNAYFIIEDDKDKNYYLGAMLYGQVFQKYLPGQFLTYSGKYYQVQTITPESGVVLRRAADHITDRKAYRQRREYSLSGFAQDPAMGSRRTGKGFELNRGFCDIGVTTQGYYDLTSLDNLASAHRVDLSSIPPRRYKNKAVLRLKLMGVSEKVRFTIALMLNEIFVTLYPESHQYITATVVRDAGSVSPIADIMSPLHLDGFADEDAVYIIEDCDIDLGLLVSVDRNLTRFLEIITDCLAWYEGRLPRSGPSAASVTAASQQDNVEETIPLTLPKKYADSCFLLYGYSQVDPMLSVQETLRFLSCYGYDKNALEQARASSEQNRHITDISPDPGALPAQGLPGATTPASSVIHFCDFCGIGLAGGEYDVLADGRERCPQCAKSSLKTVEKFYQLYEYALRHMETLYGIRIKAPIKLRMADAGKIAELTGVPFVQSPEYKSRALAFAAKEPKGYAITIENGAPKIAAMANIVHELTHIWQLINWDRTKIIARYGEKNTPMVYEGMSTWAEIQFLYSIEPAYAKRQEMHARSRHDVYGRGFMVYARQYPFESGPEYGRTSPFQKEWPLERKTPASKPINH
ncbi:MAG: hypothetical protein FWG40_04830 [Peptococcaceae bacterium]|nr:hypothetical protein [Peptococcaceae bacterium]